jgi:hypothetical protein
MKNRFKKIDGKRKRIFPADFVLHSLRHTMLTRLGESGVDAFTIMRIAGHSSIHGFAAVHPSHSGSGGTGFRAVATFRERSRGSGDGSGAKMTATRYGIRYTRWNGYCKSLMGL